MFKFYNTLTLIVLLICLNSCAVLVHGPTDTIEVKSSQPHTQIKAPNGRGAAIDLPAKIVVPRLNETLVLNVITEEDSARVFVPARRSGWVFGNLIFIPYLVLPAALIDFTHQTQAFDYKKRIYIHEEDGYWELLPRKAWPEIPPVAVELAIPLLSHHIHATRSGTRYSANLFGAEAAVRYHFSQKNFIRLGGGINATIPLFAPNWFELGTLEDRTLSAYMRVQYGWAIDQNVHLAAGIQSTYYEHLIENEFNNGFFIFNQFDRDSDSWQVGPVFSADFLPQRLVGFGFHYAPGFYSQSEEKIRFAHSLQAVIRLNLFP